jgi:hypothetical protein
MAADVMVRRSLLAWSERPFAFGIEFLVTHLIGLGP